MSTPKKSTLDTDVTGFKLGLQRLPGTLNPHTASPRTLARGTGSDQKGISVVCPHLSWHLLLHQSSTLRVCFGNNPHPRGVEDNDAGFTRATYASQVGGVLYSLQSLNDPGRWGRRHLNRGPSPREKERENSGESSLTGNVLDHKQHKSLHFRT